jgi:two-component system, sensor histidine kinase and response regulator
MVPTTPSRPHGWSPNCMQGANRMGTSPSPKAKVLLVDDLEDNLLALEAALRRDGLEMLSARSGREALELLRVHEVALALLDVQMPELDGFELAELMRGTERTRHVPIIFLTAGTQHARRVFRGYEVGAVDFLFKPIDPVLLGHKVTTFVDLYDQRRERERLADELREMLRLNEMFVAAVSHDLRSPLATLMMGAATLEVSVDEPNARRTLGRMRAGAARMTRMLDRLGDLARARLDGGIPIEPRPMDLRPLAAKMVEELSTAHPDRQVTLEVAPGDTTGVWDEERLGQVLANLLGNALRHGARETSVDVVLRADADRLTVEVKNGGEIPAALLEHLFDPFRHGNEAARARDSLGLGLYIARHIVVAHGGTIEARSSPTEGVVLRVALPRASERRPSKG